MLANIPCKHFPIIYGFIERFTLEVILKTCKVTDIPPNPSKKADMITIVEKFLV